MWWWQRPKVMFTPNARKKMGEYKISEDTALRVFNKPDHEYDTEYGKRRERRWGKEVVCLLCMWISSEKRWLITSCWKMYK